jgi:hypothetical protein
MLLPQLVRRHCAHTACTRSWRTVERSLWHYCSRPCAIQDGALSANQDYRDYVAGMFELPEDKPKRKKRRIK